MKMTTTTSSIYFMSPVTKYLYTHFARAIKAKLLKYDDELLELKHENKRLKKHLNKYKRLTHHFSHQLSKHKQQSALSSEIFSSKCKRLNRHISRLQRLSIQLIRQVNHAKQTMQQQQSTITCIQQDLNQQTMTLHSHRVTHQTLLSNSTQHKENLDRQCQHNSKLEAHNTRLYKKLNLAYFIMIILTLLSIYLGVLHHI